MESLFTIPIGVLTVSLTIVFVLALAVTAAFALRNPVMLKMALRNIPRRRAQTVLIVLGLMLATLLFSASFVTGDTLTRSFRAQAVQQLGLLDVLVFSEEQDAASGAPVSIPQETADAVRAAVANAPVDAVAPVLSVHAPALSPESGRNVPVLALFGLDPAQADGFGAYRDAAGRELSVGGLSPGEAHLSEDAATELRAAPGDEIAVYLGQSPASIRVAGVFAEGGSSHSPAPAAVMRLADAQELLGERGRIAYVYLSLDGDAIAGGTSEANEEAALEALKPILSESGLNAEAVKGDAIDAADTAGGQIADFFLLFGSFSIMAGILLIALIFVMLAAERKRELGIARAVAAQRGHIIRLFTFEGAVYSLLAAAVGSGLGVVVGLLMVRIMAAAFGSIEGLTITFSFRWQSMLLAYTLGMVSTYAVVVVSAWRVSALNIVRAVRDIPEPPHEGHRIGEWWRGACVPYAAGWRALLQLRVHQTLALWLFAGPWAFAKLVGALFMSGYLMILLGVWLVNGGVASGQEGTFLLGISLLCVGVPFAIRHVFRIPERLVYTVAGVLLVGLWIRDWNWQALGVPELDAGIQLFVISAGALVIGGVWIVMYNAAFLANVVTRVMGRGALSPVVRTAVAYPMASRFRTGMTLAMFSLVIFTLSVVAFIGEAFSVAFDDTRRASGGFDLAASVSFANPIEDIGARIEASPNLDRSDFAAIGGVTGLPVRIRQAGADQAAQDWYVTGVDRAYAEYAGHGFSLMDDRYASARDVWLALDGDENAVVVRSTLVPGSGGPGGPESPFQLEGVSENDDQLPEIYVEFAAQSGETARFRVIGVIDDGAFFSGDFETDDGIGISVVAGRQALARLAGAAPPYSGYDFALSDPSRAEDIRLALEDEFVENGLDATDLAVTLRTANSATTTFFRLLQGFMGLGLVVGIAALGVIAARSVVERRVQIGVLRAVGFRAGMVQFAFLLESSFIALLGIAVGLALGFGLSVDIVNEIGETTPGLSFQVPWATIIVVVVVGFFASLLTTYLPARQASRIYPAEALRSDE